MNNTPIDFLAIGDIVTDAFIRIKDARVACDIDDHNCTLNLRFGDKVPYESVEEVRAVGNSANAAVSAARLGVSAALMANVGNDHHGDNCLSELQKNSVSTEYVNVHEGMSTNYHYVLWYDVDRTILVKHEHYPLSFPHDMVPPKMIYLSSLGDGTEAYHMEIANYIVAHPEVKVVFQPGTFQMKMNREILKDIYANTYAFFCNVEEAKRILQIETDTMEDLFNGLHDLGPKLVFISDGGKGAYASDGTEMYFMPIYPGDAYERTGAGDAFASTISVALLIGKPLKEALMWGPVNSMSVVQYVGAQKGLLTKEKLEHYLADAPVDYVPKPLF
jgi:sugar/nucleoside kinase (ribokinase family)